MNTKGMTKYLMMVMLMTAVNIPLFIYSRSFLSSEHHEAMASTDAHEGSDIAQVQPPTALSTANSPATKEPAQQPVLEDLSYLKPPPAPLANLYRPPLLGKCKKLFERFMRQSDPEKPFRAFVYSFNGETAYCAGAVTDKSQEKAEEIAKRDCEDNQASSGKYSPCRIYTSEETN
jgi:hypothetical protein